MPEGISMVARPCRRAFSPSCVVCALLLVGVAVGLRPGMARLAQAYRKESIALRKPLDRMDYSKAASFRQVPLTLRDRVDLKDVGTKDAILVQLAPKQMSPTQAPLVFFVTYYSSPGDKVPHTPEVCYRQGGTVVEELTTIKIDTPELSPKSSQTEVRLLSIRQADTNGIILYVFYASGRFCWDREQVRWILNQPGDRYVYFSKIEVILQVPHGADPAPRIELGKKCLREVLPILVEEHFPTDDQLR